MYPQTMASLRRTDPARSARPARLGKPAMPARPCSDGDGLRWMLCEHAIFCRRFATTSAPFVGALQGISDSQSSPRLGQLSSSHLSAALYSTLR